MNNKEKITREYGTESVIMLETGYYNERYEFIYHSFDDQPSRVDHDSFKIWHKYGICHREGNKPAKIWSGSRTEYRLNGKQYWYINDKQYFNKDEIFEEYKDKIITVEKHISQNLTNMNIDFIYLNYYNGCHGYLILNDSDRNEIILKLT